MLQRAKFGKSLELLLPLILLLGSAARGGAQFFPNQGLPLEATWIETLQSDPDAGRRREAARALGQRAGLSAINALAQAAAFDPDRQVRAAAGDAIALIRRRAAGNWVGRPPSGAHAYRELVESWYQLYLHRASDGTGLRDFVDRLRRGVSPEAIQAEILASDEYYRLHGSRPRSWVAGLYADVLDRSPLQQEVQGWVRTLDRYGGSRQKTAEEFLRGAKVELAQRIP